MGINFEEYVPFNKQIEFHNHPARYKLYGGSMGGAKTTAICAESIRLSLEFPGNVGYLCRKTYRDFKRTTLVELDAMLPSKIVKRYNKVDGEIDLFNGSRMYIGDLEQTDKLKSMNLGWYGIDEASEASDDLFNMLNTRLRLNLPNIKYFGLLASNPEPGWLKDRFVDPQLQGNPRHNHVFIQSLPTDNPHLPKDYVENLIRELPPLWRRKYIEGSWDVFDSQIFRPEWIIPSESIPVREDDIMYKITVVDPAISEEEEADDTVISTFGMTYEGIIHELETIAGKWSFDKILANCQSSYKRNKPNLFGVEYVAFQKALGDMLIKLNIPVTPIRVDMDKTRRAIAQTDFFEQKLVRINNKIMQKQLLEFPKGSHDDYVDVTTHALKLFRQYSKAGRQRIIAGKYDKLDPISRMFWLNYDKEIKGEIDKKIDFDY